MQPTFTYHTEARKKCGHENKEKRNVGLPLPLFTLLAINKEAPLAVLVWKTRRRRQAELRTRGRWPGKHR